MKDLDVWAENRGWTVSLQGRKLYAVPHYGVYRAGDGRWLARLRDVDRGDELSISARTIHPPCRSRLARSRSHHAGSAEARELMGRAMGTGVSYFWRPYLERGLTRETFANNECDILLDMPADYESLLTTIPIYRSTYVLAYRDDSALHFEDLDDPRLKTLRLGAFQHSGIRLALAKHGVRDNVSIHVISHDADLSPEKQPWRQVQEVVDGDLDVFILGYQYRDPGGRPKVPPVIERELGGVFTHPARGSDRVLHGGRLGTAVLPRLGARWAVTPALTLSAGAGRYAAWKRS